MPPTPPRTCCTRPLKPYHGVFASTMTHSPGLRASAVSKAPGTSLARCAAARAASSRSNRNSSISSPTSRSPAAPPLSTCWRKFRTSSRSWRACTSMRARCSARNWLCRRSCRARSSASALRSSSPLAASWRSSSAEACSAVSAWASRSSARRSCSCSRFSRSSALRCRASNERWSSLRSASARCTKAGGSSNRRAVSIACDSPTVLRTSLKVGRPFLYSMATISVRGSCSAQFFSCMQCVVATTRAPVPSSASSTALASAAPCCGSVPVPASSTITSARVPA
mmetsp:Transcript_78955/g.218491  ORF Transcript_78955/g.218491 Transcript_78955/m.218491 type:complete len:283 (+) Transcript_78955:398-1246(+)